jgi:hypothetical protein
MAKLAPGAGFYGGEAPSIMRRTFHTNQLFSELESANATTPASYLQHDLVLGMLYKKRTATPTSVRRYRGLPPDARKTVFHFKKGWENG